MILDKGNVLTSVQQYRLQRPDDIIRIEVHQVILGANAKFVAVPVQPLGNSTTRGDLRVEGASELEAVELLIGKIQSLPRTEIFPSSQGVGRARA